MVVVTVVGAHWGCKTKSIMTKNSFYSWPVFRTNGNDIHGENIQLPNLQCVVHCRKWKNVGVTQLEIVASREMLLTKIIGQPYRHGRTTPSHEVHMKAWELIYGLCCVALIGWDSTQTRCQDELDSRFDSASLQTSKPTNNSDIICFKKLVLNTIIKAGKFYSLQNFMYKIQFCEKKLKLVVSTGLSA